MSENKYYRLFEYRILKKFSVQDHKIIKNYSKKGIYIYIIHETIDKNRFIYVSNNHYDDNTIINPHSFDLHRISKAEDINLDKTLTKYNDIYFKIISEKTLWHLDLTKFAIFKRTEKKGADKDGEWYFSAKNKVHTKKIAIENPLWFEGILKENAQIKSFIKKFEKNVYVQNNYNEQIKETFISTLFELKNNKYQTWNDHTIILDQGKTGKSSITALLSKKCDNISIAGLYGSSNSKEGKFTGGLVTTTHSAVCIDELNELAENTKNDKILSILNTFLENGVYNYVKQFSAEVKGQNQFLFFGNLTEEFNFGVMLNNLIGNSFTFGRRIGIIVYNSKLEGYKRGLILPEPTPYMFAIKHYLSALLNNVFYNTKFYTKCISHRLYTELSTYYAKELNKLNKGNEEELSKYFINSHKETINRCITRALKLYLYSNLDEYLNEKKPIYEHQIVYEVLIRTKTILDSNISNIKNMVTDINSIDQIKSNKKYIKTKFEKEPKFIQNLIEFFYHNKKDIIDGGTNYNNLHHKKEIKIIMSHYRTGRRSPINTMKALKMYGCLMKFNKDKEIMCYFTNISIFNNKTKGVFDDFEEIEDINLDKTTKKELKVVEEEKTPDLTPKTIDFDDDIF